MQAFISNLSQCIKDNAQKSAPVAVLGGGTKSFYGGNIVGEAVDMCLYAGIIEYEAKELVLTVRAGTTLVEIEAAMDAENQMLPFEPPHFGGASDDAKATIGGTVAAGLSGPRRAYAGSVRDFVLGTRIMNGRGEDLSFGGRVIKNVAGYDVSRLMAGAMGTLGVLLDLSFKVLPKPAAEVTLRFELDEAEAIQRMNEWAGKPLPLSATCWFDNTLWVRLSGAVSGVKAAQEKMGGECLSPAGALHRESQHASAFWASCRDHRHAFFQGNDDHVPLLPHQPLWRLSVPATTPPLKLDSPQFIEWGGALRWVRGNLDAKALRAKVESVGGHAILFRGGDKSAGVFHPLQATLVPIHRHLKAAFDPANILNRGRLDNF